MFSTGHTHEYRPVAIDKDNCDDGVNDSFRRHRPSGICRRRPGIMAAFVLTIVFIIALSTHHIPQLIPNAPTLESLPPRHLHMLVPASTADAGLCKSVISQAVLGYPSPVLINYRKEFGDLGLIAGGSHIAKIYGVLDFLRKLDASNDDDLVLIADGYDVWYQLPPSVLIERYLHINARANERIRQQIGGDDHPTQKVIFSAQKRCWPREASDAACYAVPESSLPEDLYGDETDTEIDDEGNRYSKYRQRYLNSGSCIGTVSAVRAVFERAKEMADEDKGFGSDQGIFADIFGEQELQRQALAKENRRKRHVSRRTLASEAEFGIGLDYESQIQLVTVFCEDETAWVAASDSATIEELAVDMGGPWPPRAGTLPAEISDSTLPAQQDWNESVLFTHMWSGIAPVTIHHNAHRDSLKLRIEFDWDKPWFAPHLRAMLDDRAAMEQHAIAVTNDALHRKQEWWSASNKWDGVATDTGEWVGYQDLCGGDGVWDEVLRDGLGRWSSPKHPQLPQPDASGPRSNNPREATVDD